MKRVRQKCEPVLSADTRKKGTKGVLHPHGHNRFAIVASPAGYLGQNESEILDKF